MINNDLVQKLWSLCDILRDDGINYSDYVSELALMLFLKMEFENAKSGVLASHKLPEFARWDALAGDSSEKNVGKYRELLSKLSKSKDLQLAAIYKDAKTNIREDRHFSKIVEGIDAIDWFSAQRDGLGELYEGLLEKNASEVKSGAGQYFTPRPLIDCMVRTLKPKVGEVIQDPAAGTAGFLIAAHMYILESVGGTEALDEAQLKFQREKAFIGVELVAETRRLALMNCLLHGIEGSGSGAVRLGNTLSSFGSALPSADIIFSNPPFGTAKGGGGPTRVDLPFSTGNKQLAFLQHIYLNLKIGGRAAVVVPDNVLFESGQGAEIRRDLMDRCNLHTILRLPTGIFYAPGVKTNVIFFERLGGQGAAATKSVWFYDLRSNMPKFGRRTPFDSHYFDEFENLYTENSLGIVCRDDSVSNSRSKRLSRTEIRAAKDNLDFQWLQDDNLDRSDSSSAPALLIESLCTELEAVLADLRSLVTTLGSGEME